MRVGVMIPLGSDAEKCVAPMAALGFASCQLSVWDMGLYGDAAADSVLEALARHGMALTALWCGWSGPVSWKYPDMYATLGLVPAYLRGRRTEDLIRGAAFAHRLGVRDVVTHAGFLPDNPFDPDRVQTVQALRHICGPMADRGQRFLFETGEELPVTLLRVMEEVGTGNLGVNFDPANLLMNGRANPLDALSLLAPHVMGFHAKDGVYPGPGQGKGAERRLGEGRADFPALIGALRRAGYQGDITIEREIPSGPERDRDLIEAKRTLERIIKEAEG